MAQSFPLTQSYWQKDISEDLWEVSAGDLLREVAAECPKRIALVDGVEDVHARRRWTYQELLQTAETLARGLLSEFTQGDKIAIVSPNCAEWVLLQHAMSLAGIVLVPVNPAYGEQEVATILSQCDAKAAFYKPEYRGRNLGAMLEKIGEKLACKAISIEALDEFSEGADLSIILPDIPPRSILQIQFTSGTTGVPKGACLHHFGAVNTSRFVAKRAGFPVGGVWVNAMPMFHIAGTVVTSLGTLAQRGTYVIVPGFEPELILDLFETEKGNVSLLVPTMILAMMESPSFAKRNLSSVTTILTGAADVPKELVYRTKEAFNCNLVILFGQTEVNGVVSQTRVEDSAEDQSSTLGLPLPHAEVCLIDPETGEIQPIGEAGEICVRGYQNMLAYYNAEEATKKTIREDGWLCTGDSGVMDERGYIKITGRLKDMIIRGGMNIYPREIEEVLFNHPAINQASVIGIPDPYWGEVIAAIIIPEKGCEPPNFDVLFSHCRAHLSPHKSPVKWAIVDDFPLTPSGKVQKFALRDLAVKGDLILHDIDKKSALKA
ncbi:MAG: AMP-binding protein [Zhongshania sp.]|uniref:class I adenylate-forming enzyme family protein n=1 Tax=Zhongshania sp. TaxID=1971902 RepID=UPI00263801F3|nr:AMP-binding protein [Zhongshania sp.]MDF1693679.1 AMP-binding protein [Zhongshania sp.]